jgi:hypothetical protein
MRKVLASRRRTFPSQNGAEFRFVDSDQQKIVDSRIVPRQRFDELRGRRKVHETVLSVVCRTFKTAFVFSQRPIVGVHKLEDHAACAVPPTVSASMRKVG